MKQSKTKLLSGLHALLWKEGKWFVAKCVEVEVASQGKNRNEAVSNLSEALSLYFEEDKKANPPVLQDVELRTIKFSYA